MDVSRRVFFLGKSGVAAKKLIHRAVSGIVGGGGVPVHDVTEHCD
jgi:hypothetical protein